jgi:hypothetical protein
MSERAGRFAIAAGCVVFLVVSLPHLDRVPRIHNDEPTILAPGLKLFSRGVFGLDMLDGLAGASRHYLEVMPAMSVLEGGVASVAGVGVWQMRLVPVALGMATLVLAGLLALRLGGAATAGLTVFLLLLWRWTPGGAEFLPSGIPLVDVSRIARYDILAAPLGLASLLAFVSARTVHSPVRHAVAGALVGLATLATPFGAFWGIALLALLPIEAHFTAPAGRHARRDAGLVIGGAALLLLPWVAFALAHWSELRGQLERHTGRFDLGRPAFYLGSLLHEVQRYQLGLRSPGTYARVGFWLLVIGVPAAFASLARRAAKRRSGDGVWLLVPCAILPTLLALLVNVKRFYYLAAVVPLFAVLLGWGIAAFWRASRPLARGVVVAVLAVAAVQGVAGIARMHATGANVGAPGPFFARLRAAVAPGARRIVGPHPYWFAFTDREYRSFTLPVSIMAAAHCPLKIAFARVAPDAVLLDPYLTDVYTHLPSGSGPATVDDLRALLSGLGLSPTVQLVDNTGALVEVWEQPTLGPAPAETGRPDGTSFRHGAQDLVAARVPAE